MEYHLRATMKNLDTIDVRYSETTYECGTMIEYISLILNGEPVKGTFDAYAFAFPSTKKVSKEEILTCSCGVAGCAGIFDGTEVKRRRYTVEWRDIDCGLPKRFYSFDKVAYDAAVAKVMQLMFEIAAKREARGYDEDTYDGILGFHSVADLEQRIAWAERWWRS